MRKLIQQRISESMAVKNELRQNPAVIDKIREISDSIAHTFDHGGKVIFAGNGGSFSDAMHLVGEFVCRFMLERRSLPALVLGANNAALTAIGNDYAYEEIFARELAALGKPGDVFIAISTSGNSGNILRAVEAAGQQGLTVFGLSGGDGGKLSALCDCICVPTTVTARIQEAHILIGHIICELVEKRLFANT